MKFFLLTLGFVVVTASPAFTQSGRKSTVTRTPPPTVEEPARNSNSNSPAPAEPPPVTAEKNQDYRCTDDGTLARVLDPKSDQEPTFTTKQVDTRATILARPNPSYTREARRYGVQGYVVLRVVLSSTGKVGRITVVRRLPAGLTESAIRAACKIEFKPAIKDGRAVSQLTQVEYTFRLADSSIFGP